MRPDALIFDLDGTLWDTSATCAAAWNRVVRRLGLEYRAITAEDVSSVAGQPHPDGIRRVFGGLAEASIAAITHATESEDVAAVREFGGVLYPGVGEEIPKLRRALPLMIVSNCQRGYIEAFLAWSGLAAHFVDHECWGNTGLGKSANLAAVIARSGVRAPWFIGDTEGDRRAALDNRVHFVHATYGFGRVEHADARLESFAELVALVESAPALA